MLGALVGVSWPNGRDRRGGAPTLQTTGPPSTPPSTHDSLVPGEECSLAHQESPHGRETHHPVLGSQYVCAFRGKEGWTAQGSKEHAGILRSKGKEIIGIIPSSAVTTLCMAISIP